jgi:hypothetical protein
MRPITEYYVRRCEKLGREPDAERLRPILERLEQLPDESGEEEAEDGLHGSAGCGDATGIASGDPTAGHDQG